MRIVSLLPSATEMVHFSGARDSLVGVTHECDHPPGVEALPALTSPRLDPAASSAEIDAAVGRLMTDEGSLYALDAELLESLTPDLVVTQGLCEVCAVSAALVRRALSGLSSEPEILSLNPTSLRGVLDDTVRVGGALGREAEARRKVAELEKLLARIERAVCDLPRPRVACIEWLDPPYSAGHWVPEMVHLAGGEDVIARPGEPSVRLSWEEVFDAAPEVVALMPCGFGAERTAGESKTLTGMPGWVGLPAVESGRVWALDANSYFSRPAPRLVEGVEILGRILHPEAFPDAPDPEDALRLAASGISR